MTGGEDPDVTDFMNLPRYLCSQLVELRIRTPEPGLPQEANRIVNLEEIWTTGAVLESEEPAEEGAKAEIRCGAAFFAGSIVHVERHEFGWRLEMEFSPMTPWNAEQFQPEHLLDISKTP
jgi:hypothetical protein